MNISEFKADKKLKRVELKQPIEFREAIYDKKGKHTGKYTVYNLLALVKFSGEIFVETAQGEKLVYDELPDVVKNAINVKA